MKSKLIKSGLYVGTLTIVAGKGYLSYRYYNLIDVDMESEIDKQHVKNIINEAEMFCIKYNAQLWSY